MLAQTLPRLEAGAGAGGSAFGWQPKVGLGGESPTISLGWMALSAHGSFARIDGAGVVRSASIAGARLSVGAGDRGWWLAGDVIRRAGLHDLIEQPRISGGGWGRFGPLTIAVSASRRAAQLSDTRYFTREVVTYFDQLDSVSGQWDTIPHTTTVADSARTNASRLWAETQGTLTWDASRWSAQLTAGGRLSTRDVPGGAWAGAELAVRLTAPLALVLGGGTATTSHFVLDAEHRYLTLGFRILPRGESSEQAKPSGDDVVGIGPLGIDSLSAGRYRLSLWVPRAHSVELSGDFTGWKPVSLERGEGGQWSISLVLLPGAHRVNARIDRGAWIVPPGLTTISDDYAGTVGVLVVDGGGGEK